MKTFRAIFLFATISIFSCDSNILKANDKYNKNNGKSDIEEKLKQDSITSIEDTENFCIGTWKQTEIEKYGKMESINRDPNVLTLYPNKTYKEKLSYSDGSYKFETGIWQIKNGNLIIYLLEGEWANYIVSTHYLLQGDKLISKYQIYQSGVISNNLTKHIFQKVQE